MKKVGVRGRGAGGCASGHVEGGRRVVLLTASGQLEADGVFQGLLIAADHGTAVDEEGRRSGAGGG